MVRRVTILSWIVVISTEKYRSDTRSADSDATPPKNDCFQGHRDLLRPWKNIEMTTRSADDRSTAILAYEIRDTHVKTVSVFPLSALHGQDI